MSYHVHNFKTGEIIEAAPVNEMDDQIQKNEQDISGKLDSDKVGVAGGVASLDNSGKVPSDQLPQTISVEDDGNGNVTLNL